MLLDYVQFVNDQIAFHEAMAKKFVSVVKRKEKHLETSKRFRELLDEMVRAAATPAVSPSVPGMKKPVQLMLSLEEVEGLPEELMEELSISSGDKADYAVLRVVEDCGGVASIDRVIVGLYRKTGEINKRNTMTSRIYRMTQKNLLFPVPNRKGVYSTKELTDLEAGALLD